MEQIQTLVITCGGTGGHFYPGLSLARTVSARGGKVVLLLGGKNSMAQGAIARRNGIEAVELPYMPSPSWRSPGSCWRFLKGALGGWRQAKRFLRSRRPQALLGMGSFASLPAVLGAHSAGIPIFLHDGNARVGRANRWFSRMAGALGTAFPAVNGGRIHCPAVTTGMPLRPELAEQRQPREAAQKMLVEKYGGSLEPERFTILIFGGSQGARKLNEAFGAAVKQAVAAGRPWQVIHLTGAGEFAAMAGFWHDAGVPGVVLPTLDEMGWAYSACDLVIGRSGGSSAAEINAFGKYAVVVPYPFASELHQNDNAAWLAAQGAAEVAPNDRVTAESAGAMLERLSGDVELLRRKGARSVRPEAWEGCERVLAMVAGGLAGRE